MISRAALARSVCLRCQLRLLDRPRALSSLRTPPFRSEFLQRRQYSSESAWDRLEANSKEQKAETIRERKSTSSFSFKDEPASKPAGPPSNHTTTVEEDAVPTKHNETESEASTEATPKKDSPLLFKKYNSRERRDHKRIGNRQVYLEREHLDVSMLGEKARTIVMRDSRNQKSITQLPIEELLPPEQLDIASRLEAEEKDLSMEEALGNIDELRPSDPILYQHQFDELLEVLANGFTIAQLRTYLIAASSTALKMPQQKEAEYSWLEAQWPWTPLQKIEVVGSPKERMCITLLKEAWQLKIREMVDGKGVFAAKVKERLLALLARDDKRLASIRQTYLDAGEKIQISRSRVRILASKAKTETILKKLDEAAQDIVVKEFEAGWITSNGADAALLEHLGQHTNTFITYNKANAKASVHFWHSMSSHLTVHQINVSWFKDATAEEGQEPQDNVVQRLLYTALHPRDASINLKYPEDNDGRLVPEVRGREKLSWKDKLTQWSRWVKPTGRVGSLQPEVNLDSKDVLSRPLQALPQDLDGPWSKPYSPIFASFGHVLHKGGDNFSLVAAAKSTNHIFSPTSPPPANLASLSKAVTSSKPVTTSLILSFRPHPSEDKKVTRNLPQLLELHLTVPEDLPEGPLSWDACPKRLVAVLDQNFTDIAYPSQPIDLRLSQPALTTMSPPALDTSPFREYIEAAKLDLLAGRLGPPSEITLSELPSTSNGKSISKPAKYMFVGLEMRRTLDVEYEGHRLQYTSIQAGHHGGRRAEMVLEATPVDGSLSEKDQETYMQKYLALVQDLAQGEVVKWVGERNPAAEHVGKDKVVEKAAAEEAGLEGNQEPRISELFESLLFPAKEQDAKTEVANGVQEQDVKAAPTNDG
ncbi:uncharacterized protein CTRU02_207372 [Colletotrichum truncatum]|uniref:Uncharacterized protein n=1 Tax=Colletotrichum truncatum TaxID=5467 RepID=A0ACC3Z0N4_COLTU|nr:uncharacterized protein CTRU02_00993 [Colletotrichum truncatum]KAF6800588.1 hypothetical protein CTRU02_00993 [Colletotrichum truncatum]